MIRKYKILETSEKKVFQESPIVSSSFPTNKYVQCFSFSSSSCYVCMYRVAGMATLLLYRILRKQYEAKVKEQQYSEGKPTMKSTSSLSHDTVDLGDETTNTTTIVTTVSVSTTNTTSAAAPAAAVASQQLLPPSNQIYPHLISRPHVKNMPWKNVYQSKYSRITAFLTFLGLLKGYLWTGKYSMFWEVTLYEIANYIPLTIAMHRSLSVLLSHLSWVVVGYVILRLVPRPQPFTSKWYQRKFAATETADNPSNSSAPSSSQTTSPQHPQWLWWTIGGYFVSSWLFNISDFINQCILPVGVLETATQSVVSQLVQPEHNDFFASLIGFLAPCISAPWWEEILYRGYLLPALILLNMPYQWSILLSSILFSLHHVQTTSYIPLCVLGYVWNVVYTKSRNLQTTMLIHAMWNSRVFIGSWLGL